MAHHGAAEHQDVLKRRQRFARDKLQPRRGRRLDDSLGIDALIRCGSGSATPGVVVDHANAPLRPERLRHVSQQRHGIVNLPIGIGDEHRIDAAREVRVGFSAEHRSHVAQILPLSPPLDRIDHRRLDIFRVDEPVRPDTAGEPDREPAAGSADLGDHRAVGDVQRVHDLIGLLPLIAIRRLEESEIQGSEETRLGLEGGRGRKGGRSRSGSHEEHRERCC